MPTNVFNLNEMMAEVSLVDEMDATLGDPRRTRRVQQVVEQIARKPGASFVEVFQSDADIEGFYRLLNNKHLGFYDLLEPHRDATVDRARKLGRVVVIHDSTEFSFPIHGGHIRKGLCKHSDARQGFWAHVSLVASADGLRCPLGVLGVRPYAAENKLADDAARQFWQDAVGALDSDHDRWLEAVEEAESNLAGVEKVIHAMDREADSFEIIATMAQKGRSFVVRLAQERCVKELQREGLLKISALLAKQPVMAQRTVTLSPRSDEGRTLSARKKHPSRRQRQAYLSFRACALDFPRPAAPKKNLRHLPTSIRVNVVEVFEEHPPEGEPAVRWLLVTSEPIATIREVLEIADLYRARWLVEEFFKSLKTGCSYTDRQLDSARSLLVALALLSPVAWHLLVIRYLQRYAPELPANAALPQLHVALLRAHFPKLPWSDEPTIAEAMGAIAKLGGHLKRNGPPGWLTLGRGYARLLDMARGYQAYKEVAGMMGMM